MQEKGTISIHTENIFPIIKKFLYSDHEIFLRELVSNAVDATQKLKRLSSLGQVKGDVGDLRVEIAFDEKKKTITISDNGIGIPAEYREKAFQIFKRVPTERKYEGSGIGLAICKKIVEGMGGTIRIEDNRGGGTTFRIAVPHQY